MDKTASVSAADGLSPRCIAAVRAFRTHCLGLECAACLDPQYASASLVSSFTADISQPRYTAAVHALRTWGLWSNSAAWLDPRPSSASLGSPITIPLPSLARFVSKPQPWPPFQASRDSPPRDLRSKSSPPRRAQLHRRGRAHCRNQTQVRRRESSRSSPMVVSSILHSRSSNFWFFTNEPTTL